MPFLADLRVRRFDYLEFHCHLQHPEGRKEKCVLGSGRHTMRVYMVKVVTHVCVHGTCSFDVSSSISCSSEMASVVLC